MPARPVSSAASARRSASANSAPAYTHPEVTQHAGMDGMAGAEVGADDRDRVVQCNGIRNVHSTRLGKLTWCVNPGELPTSGSGGWCINTTAGATGCASSVSSNGSGRSRKGSGRSTRTLLSSICCCSTRRALW